MRHCTKKQKKTSNEEKKIKSFQLINWKKFRNFFSKSGRDAKLFVAGKKDIRHHQEAKSMRKSHESLNAARNENNRGGNELS